MAFRWILFLLVALLSVTVSAQDPTPEVKETPKANARPTPLPDQAPEPFDKADVRTLASQCVAFDTEAGVIEMEMYPEHAPESVRNFLNLVATGLFDTTSFDRVVPNFVIQGGNIWSREDKKVTRAMGNRARRTIPDEPNKILHERGILSMARADEPNTATTNFFILVAEAAYLNNKFAAFGKVTKGIDVVDAINKAPVSEEKPEKPVRIKKATTAPCAAKPV
jgi:peptidyl-prolyl cis-trans isomerase B (cyclophilin B)